METIPESVIQFLDGNVESIEQLEILRVLAEDPRRRWDLNSLARVVQAAPRSVRGHLAAMCERGLVEMTGLALDVSCRYGRKPPELERRIRRLLEIYRERPVTVIRLVYERAGAARLAARTPQETDPG
ncbi:hypothetical protein OJF2_19280 [Aquisphaera giovannonii]|uniref:HTH arsR-type domain-containing protein n=1 Tax=Aquisphaera giovannonii TaxID=406548 RepID=A0A5B9VYI1_9BACT|nr:hypothetical protein [Aquisphaera giovannonii]QEH33426.1 hypothetical protein OJF2_19280 [Aquisphaera giovannonii]